MYVIINITAIMKYQILNMYLYTIFLLDNYLGLWINLCKVLFPLPPIGKNFGDNSNFSRN